MNSCALIIPTCRHILPNGRRCLQPAARRRRCCRHHLDAQARLHNMARARRCTLALRLRVPETSRDLAWNKLELNRVLATERIDPDAALMMLWAMDLTAETLRAKPNCRPRRTQKRASNPNGIYDVPLNPLFPQSLSANVPQVIENTKRHGGGGTPIARTHTSGSLPAAPSGLNRSQRRRLAAINHSEERMTKSERLRAKRKVL
jgi:hypothetical protein